MILKKYSLDFQWPTVEPFIFCVHHDDQFPQGNGNLGVEPYHLQGRDVGQDFVLNHGFRMYHGDDVPGFPVHPHRGFETVTIVRRGYIDHADSMGAAGRYGQGDVQWMTAGSGVQHSEMFPLLKTDETNPVELFQIWLNLPRKNKMVSPYFKMFWAENIPVLELDEQRVQVMLIAGELAGKKALSPPPKSWAADPQNGVMILLVRMQKGAEFLLPAGDSSIARMLYLFTGEGLVVNGESLGAASGAQLECGVDAKITAVNGQVEFLVLQARPIGEPIAQHGPFVMNSKDEIMQAITDYRRTEFGGWSWPRPDMVHGPAIERFARYPDGKVERPPQS